MKRQAQGIVFLLFALFFANARSCGVLGRCVAHATVWLIGAQGLHLLVTGLTVAGVALSGLGRLMWRGLCGAWKTWTTPVPIRKKAAQPALTLYRRVRDFVPLKTPVEAGWHHDVELGTLVTRGRQIHMWSPSQPPPVRPEAKPAPTPATTRSTDTVQRQEVRGGLKWLGYTKEEIDTVIDRLKGSTEEQLRVGIKLLQRAA